jgi:hypothetical protein
VIFPDNGSGSPDLSHLLDYSAETYLTENGWVDLNTVLGATIVQGTQYWIGAAYSGFSPAFRCSDGGQLIVGTGETVGNPPINFSSSATFSFTANSRITYTTISVTAISVSDSGQGTETVSIHEIIPVAVSDSGHGSDSVGSIGVLLWDSGHGADSLTIKVTLGLTDSGQGAEKNLIKMSYADSGHGSDSVGPLRILVNDRGRGTDLTGVEVNFTVTDSGHGRDLSGGIQVQVTDAGHGHDVATWNVSVQVSDRGVGLDSITSSASFSVQDQGVGFDVATRNIPGQAYLVSVHVIQGTVLVSVVGAGVDIVMTQGQVIVQVESSDS